ncbi:ABC transporter substrate-binding protein [Glaciibacter sp. 2TAF33]|uniref:ABC transporter substrate-binding protein n=1 Tax=Glaciibacter sp. 2TAF33 TaxID=3233015 RepID=UPI003F91492C
MRFRYTAIASAAILALALSACSGGSAGKSVVTAADKVEVKDGLVIDGELIADQNTYDVAKTQTLTLYTGYQEANQVAFNNAFTADTGIKVEYVRDVTNKLAERILSESGAKQLGADVIITSDYKVANSFSKAGVWDPFTPLPIADDADLQHDDGNFTTFASPAVSFAYNTQLVAPENAPTSWRDLLDPANAGKIGITSGTAGGSSIALNRFLQEKVDPQFWTKLAALNPTIFDSGGQRQEALARGELNVATAGTAAVNVAVTQDNAPLALVVPDEGLVLFSFFIGKVAQAKNSEAAEVFINYALSERGQSVISQVGDYAARADVAPPVVDGVKLPRLDSDKVWMMPAEKELEFGSADADVWKAAFGR